MSVLPAGTTRSRPPHGPRRSGLHRADPFPALGTTAALVVDDPAVAAEALRLLRAELDAVDRACSRFRDDSELVGLNARSGHGPVPVSSLLLAAVEAALWAHDASGGLVDPTVGSALELIGYDRDFPAIAPDGPALTFAARPVPGATAVTVDHGRSTVALRPGTRLDLGATAKALCADRAAARIAAETGAGVLVSLGGDIAVAGPAPAEGWPVRIGDDHTAPLDGPGPVLALRSGGLATSSTAVRAWRRGGRPVHHIVDPSSSRPAAAHWRTVSVAAGGCLHANVASCAAVVMGAGAPRWLEGRRLPARLVATGGDVTVVAGWPPDERASAAMGAPAC